VMACFGKVREAVVNERHAREATGAVIRERPREPVAKKVAAARSVPRGWEPTIVHVHEDGMAGEDERK